ncbi:DUF1365 domain-containing protein [Undibacterium aquatile]|uniref:DUF1365 domain-containing protein n=1 Tax=Undibacterium aquatile TaxID=1537398 RepID=A0ABR6XIK7_9BURK|nr:DUF1365 domain-containing protein [Undibacterium aquatile]MBC3812593.1 DUF1365 domain-containing protein [Undibacterium aquatile]
MTQTDNATLKQQTASPTIRLCTGEVMHKRLRPAKNAFRYGVFFIRVPVRVLTSQTLPVHARFFSHNRFNLLSFFDKDHGDAQQPLSNWLDAILHEHGINDADGEIWLQCFPRVLGYVFNPVSFWFCHRRNGSLRAIVCEVRNTFGEKHIYLLEQGDTLLNGQELHAKKIFHVSPFCAVEGNYRFRFLQTQQHDAQHNIRHIARIDYDDRQGPVLITSVSGEEQAMTDQQIVKVMLRYPLMTFGVVARIHLQALRLWLKRVPFFSKPTPPSQEVSR